MVEIIDRTKFLGGSDIAGVLGLSRYKTPLSVWAEKTGEIPPNDDDTLQKKLGRRLEDVVAELFTEKTGMRVQRANERRIHPKYPYFAAQIDRLIVGADELLECKTASAWIRKEWVDDEIPQEYICQVMWQLACSGRRRGHIAVLIGNQDFLTKTIERDPVLIAEMLKRADIFWNTYVIPKLMPMQVSAADTQTLSFLFPLATPGLEVDLGDEAAKMAEQRNAMIQDKILLEKQIEGVDNELKILLREAESANAGIYKIRWVNVKRKAYSVPESSYRKFEVKMKREE